MYDGNETCEVHYMIYKKKKKIFIVGLMALYCLCIVGCKKKVVEPVVQQNIQSNSGIEKDNLKNIRNAVKNLANKEYIALLYNQGNDCVPLLLKTGSSLNNVPNIAFTYQGSKEVSNTDLWHVYANTDLPYIEDVMPKVITDEPDETIRPTEKDIPEDTGDEISESPETIDKTEETLPSDTSLEEEKEEHSYIDEPFENKKVRIINVLDEIEKIEAEVGANE